MINISCAVIDPDDLLPAGLISPHIKPVFEGYLSDSLNKLENFLLLQDSYLQITRLVPALFENQRSEICLSDGVTVISGQLSQTFAPMVSQQKLAQFDIVFIYKLSGHPSTSNLVIVSC